MGTEVYFRAWSPELNDYADLGCAHFSAFTAELQAAAYGLDWADCLTWDDAEHQEMMGPRVGDADWTHWYEPDWVRARERVDRLWAMASARTPMRKYDLDHLPAFQALIHRCAAHPHPCQVRLSL